MVEKENMAYVGKTGAVSYNPQNPWAPINECVYVSLVMSRNQGSQSDMCVLGDVS
jgi:hypothetical protein